MHIHSTLFKRRSDILTLVFWILVITLQSINYLKHKTHKMFCMIEHDCNVINITEILHGNENFPAGTLVQIIINFKCGDHFRVIDPPNWSSKYKTTLYKFKNKNDFIVLKTEIWPYMLAIKDADKRISFVQKVNQNLFDLNILKLGSEIKIDGCSITGRNKVKFYEFVVTYSGIVTEYGEQSGSFIGLRLKNDKLMLPAELTKQSQFYKFGGNGIVTSADWIMTHLYNVAPQYIADLLKRISSCHSRLQVASAIDLPGELETKDYDMMDDFSEHIRKSEIITCELYNQTIEFTSCILLQECLHSYCRTCLKEYIVLNAKKSSRIVCPYEQTYNCPYNVLDFEIQELGGEIVYQQILQNRLDEFLRRDPNAKMCYVCTHVWMNETVEYEVFEQCPECLSRWCNVCSGPHETYEDHKPQSFTKTGSENFIGKMLHWVNRKVNSTTTGHCTKCKKMQELKSLTNCSHEFCINCLRVMIESQMYVAEYAECFICGIKLEDAEIRRLIGPKVLHNFQDNREKNQILL